jgi:hypothetical protein
MKGPCADSVPKMKQGYESKIVMARFRYLEQEELKGDCVICGSPNPVGL